MGFLDRLRGRQGGTGGADSESPAPHGDAPSTAGTPSTASPAEVPATAGVPAPPVAVAAWTALPPIQRSTGGRRPGVADAGFGGRLPTWQNPSFSGAPSPAVLDPAAGHGLLSGAFAEPARPGAESGPRTRGLPPASPAGAPAVQRMPVAPLRAIPGTPASSAAAPASAPA
ncbi:hypothetical protein ABT333_39325, partial [Streptomyces flaveolus]